MKHARLPVIAILLSIVATGMGLCDRPNVLFILADDQGWADIGYNNPRVYSPTLDRLAAEGCTFTQHYVMPQCTPTRVALLTGRYPGRFEPAALQASNEPAFKKGTPTIADMFQAAGYRTYLCGKWHLGSSLSHGPHFFGFDHSYGSMSGAVGMYDHRYRPSSPFVTTWHRDQEYIDGHENGVHATDLIAKEAVRIIREQRDAPFFLYLPFQSVHTPLDERGRFVDHPTQRDPESPGRWLHEDDIPWFHDPAGRIQAEKDPEKRLFLAAVHHLDAAIGQVVEALEQTGQRDSTLIVFSSDNGPQVNWGGDAYPDDLQLTDFNQPLPMRGKKVDVWEGGIHVPAFANWPNRIQPSRVSDPVHIIDWFPTLANLLKDQSSQSVDLDGVDISGAIFAGKPIETRELYWIWNSRTNRWALRYGEWKIVRYGRDEPDGVEDWQLFHLVADPRESNDVAADHPEVVADLHRRFLGQRAKDNRPGG